MANTLEKLGLKVNVPGGWDARIYQTPFAGAVLQASNRKLSDDYSDFGDPSWIASMPPGGIFAAVIEQDPAFAGSGIYAQGLDLPLRPSDAGENGIPQTTPGVAGLQQFFSAAGRAFALFVVTSTAQGMHGGFESVNGILRSLEISPGNYMADIPPIYLEPVP